MPEGPSITILKELLKQFENKKVLEVSGNTKIAKERALNKIIVDFKSWGKHLLICFKGFTIRIHLMLFGSYRINEEKNAVPRISFRFSNGTLNFYACSVKIIEEPLDEVYDWGADIMSDKWNAAQAKKNLKDQPNTLACDALLDQHIFSGSGNIIKNEVLFRVRLHPINKIGNIPAEKLTELINETRNYAFDFLKWKKENVLKKHWLAHTKKTCPRCEIPLIKEYLGKTNRRTFYCTNCQILHTK